MLKNALNILLLEKNRLGFIKIFGKNGQGLKANDTHLERHCKFAILFQIFGKSDVKFTVKQQT